MIERACSVYCAAQHQNPNHKSEMKRVMSDNEDGACEMEN